MGEEGEEGVMGVCKEGVEGGVSVAEEGVVSVCEDNDGCGVWGPDEE